MLQPQYRGSTGFGQNHYSKGWQAFGKEMQDDLADGIDNLAKQGVVDASRVCIIGSGGYGGYAALMGLVRNPDLYRCSVSVNGSLVDIDSMLAWNRDSQTLKTLVGKTELLRNSHEDVSPLKQVEKIKAPVLIASDKIPFRRQTTAELQMFEALKSHRKQVEFLQFSTYLPENEANAVKFFNEVEKFLKTHNPPD